MKCPHCSRELPGRARESLLAIVIGTDCCGYVPSTREGVVWTVRRAFFPSRDERGWRRSERRAARRFRVPPSPRARLKTLDHPLR